MVPSVGVRRARLALVALAAALFAGVPARAADPVRIYPLGDSITYGTTMSVESDGTWVPVVTPGGYRGELYELLAAAGLDQDFEGSRSDNTSTRQDTTGQTQHDGWSGFRIDQVAASLDGTPGWWRGQWVTGRGDHYAVHPDVAIIHLGTNDIGQRYDPGTLYPTVDRRADLADPSQRAVFVRHLTARLDALVDKLQALRPRARVVLSAVAPMATSGGTGAVDPVTQEYAAAVRALVAAERSAGEKVVLADVFAAFTAPGPNGLVVLPGLLSADNVHPAPKGYAAMASVYRDAVLAALAL